MALTKVPKSLSSTPSILDNEFGVDITGTITADGLTVSAPSGDVPASLVTTTAGSFLRFTDTNTTSGRSPLVGAVTDNLVFYTSAGGYSEKMRLFPNGNFSIGTTSSLGKLTVSNNGAEGIEFFPANITGGNTTQHYDRSGLVYLINNVIASEHRFNNGVTERMRIDASGNLLVGMSSSNYAVAGSQLGTGGNNFMTRSGAQPLLLNRLSNDGDIALFMKDGTSVGSIGTNGTHTYFVGNDSAAGNGCGLLFGINTATPVNRLGTPYDGTMNLGSSGARFRDLYLSGNIALTTADNASAANMFVSPSTDFLYLEHPANGMIFRNTSGAERMRIDSTGNVGIGTSSPVNNTNRKTLALQGAWGGQLDIMVGSTVHAQFGTDNFSSGQSCRIQSQDGIVFKSGGSSERMRIDSSGNVGIGLSNPSDYYSNNLVINGGFEGGITIVGASNNTNYLSFADSTSGTARYAGMIEYNHTADVMSFRTGSVQRMSLSATGDLSITGNVTAPTIYTTVGGSPNMYIRFDGLLMRAGSSLRYKNTVNDATHGLAELLTLRPVTYKSNSEGDIIYGGLIAEEVYAAGLPEFVQYGQDGEPDGLSYGNMVSLCIKAIQEQQAIIQEQQALTAALTARIEELENK